MRKQERKKESAGVKEFQCYCWILGFCQSRPEVLSLVFTVAVVFVVKLKTSLPLKGKLFHMSPPLPHRPNRVAALFISPQTLHSANFWAPERVIRTRHAGSSSPFPARSIIQSRHHLSLSSFFLCFFLLSALCCSLFLFVITAVATSYCWLYQETPEDDAV